MGHQVRLAINEMRSGVGAAFRWVTRYVDLLIVPFVLEATVLVCYLIARAASLSIPLALSFLAKKAAPQLINLFQTPTQSAFQAAAARANLGYLMVCGAVSLLVLASGPFLASALGGLNPAFDEILIWLIIGQANPVLFGATFLLMHAVDRTTFYELLQCVTAVLFVTGMAVLDATNGILVAQTLAAAQLTQAAICALLLTQCGVWPGLTALFHKEIKLF